MKTLKNHDQADTLMRERTPFRSRVRLYDRYGNFGPFISLSGTTPCAGRPCDQADAKQGETAWMGASEGTNDTFCHTTGSLPSEYHESLRAADFVVRSFATPIAWHVNAPRDWHDTVEVEAWLNNASLGVWIVPDVSYSITTYQHQAQVRAALHGTWRNKLQPMPEGVVRDLHIPGAPTRVRSGGR